MTGADPNAAPLLFTVGHSNRGRDELIAVLREAGVERLVDVRARPRSARNPQFDRAVLCEALAAAGVHYQWAGRRLGGMRRANPASPHLALAADGLRGYADHADTPGFREAVARLLVEAARWPTALMCAEREPANCHRSILSDHVVRSGARVVHLLGPGAARGHEPRPEGREIQGRLVYDAHTQMGLDLT